MYMHNLKYSEGELQNMQHIMLKHKRINIYSNCFQIAMDRGATLKYRF